MIRVFSYCRVSILDQTTENQRREIASAGFFIEPYRCFEENISGSVPAKERPGFNRLVNSMKNSDILVVTKLDRLGRNAIDVRQTVELLSNLGIKVHCLALGGIDLTSPAGKMIMQIVSAIAEFEHDLMLERTYSGIFRAKAAGKRFGRPPFFKDSEKRQVIEKLSAGVSVSSLAKEYNTTRQTILRVKKSC